MKTDKITVSSQGARMGAALEQAEKVAAYKGLKMKDALHLRLLTEEMIGSFQLGEKRVCQGYHGQDSGFL